MTKDKLSNGVSNNSDKNLNGPNKLNENPQGVNKIKELAERPVADILGSTQGKIFNSINSTESKTFEGLEDFKTLNTKLKSVFDTKILSNFVYKSGITFPIFDEFNQLHKSLDSSLSKIPGDLDESVLEEDVYNVIFNDFKKLFDIYQGFLFLQSLSIPARYSREKTIYDKKIFEIFSFMNEDLNPFVDKYFPGMDYPIGKQQDIDIDKLDENGVSELSSSLVKLNNSNLELSYKYITQIIEDIETSLVPNLNRDMAKKYFRLISALKKSIDENTMPDFRTTEYLFKLLRDESSVVKRYLNTGSKMSGDVESNIDNLLDKASLLNVVVSNLSKLNN